jgi:hypothetical protein
MTLPLIGIGLSYVVVTVLLLSLNLASRWHWGLKAIAIAITTAFFGVSYGSIASLIGWPSEARVPEHFQLDWATVVEPDKLNGSPGSIYLWVEALDKNNVRAGTPRAFRVPYTRDLADRIVHAKARIEQGMDQAGTARDLDIPEGPLTRTGASRARHRVRMSRAARGTRRHLSSIGRQSNLRTCRHRSYLRRDRCETPRICRQSRR